MRDNEPGIFGVFPEGTGNLDAGKKLPARGMQDYLKWVVLVLPYPAQDLFGILLIYELVGRQAVRIRRQPPACESW